MLNTTKFIDFDGVREEIQVPLGEPTKLGASGHER